MVRISTKEKPWPSSWTRKASPRMRFVHAMAAGVCIAPRAGRDRGRAPVERLQDVHVDDPGSGGVAADAADADRPRRDAQLGEQLEDDAQRERLAAARTERVVRREEQIRLGRDLLQRRLAHAAALPR